MRWGCKVGEKKVKRAESKMLNKQVRVVWGMDYKSDSFGLANQENGKCWVSIFGNSNSLEPRNLPKIIYFNPLNYIPFDLKSP